MGWTGGAGELAALEPAARAVLDGSPTFRKVVFAAFAERKQAMMQLIETVSFMRVEARLATLILDRAGEDGGLAITQAEIARAIGTAREVVSRRLDKLARSGAIRAEPGSVRIRDRALLEALAASPAV